MDTLVNIQQVGIWEVMVPRNIRIYLSTYIQYKLGTSKVLTASGHADLFDQIDRSPVTR